MTTLVISKAENTDTAITPDEIIAIGIKYGWRHDHPAVRSLIHRHTMPTAHEVDERLNPNSLTNVRWQDGVLHVVAPFDNQAYGGLAPISLLDIHLPPDWGSDWFGIVLESDTLIFTSEDGSEIVRVHRAGCGTRVRAVNAEQIIRYYTSLLTPTANFCSILAALMDVPDTFRLGRRGLSYGVMSFRYEAGDWIHKFC